MSDPIDVAAVRGKADLKAFIDLPYRLYSDDPLWVAPLKMDIKEQLNPKKIAWLEL